MEDKSTYVETRELLQDNDLQKERWKGRYEKEDIVKDKLRLLLVLCSFLILLSLVAVVSILAWAYIEEKQNAGEGAQLHEPTRLYSSTQGITPLFANVTQYQRERSYEDQEQRSDIPGDSNGQMHLIRVYEGLSSGAVCLDGTPPAYYLRRGRDLGIKRWLIHFNGGAWCFDEAACLERSRGSLGSTKHLPPSPPVIQGINSANEQINPDFYDWNLVWIVYCDGGSFTGDREDPVVVHGENIFFRGKRVLDAVITDLMKRGFQDAEGVILTGSSAGSMTAMFAVDRLAERLPNVPMHVLSDAGYFIETQQMGGKSVSALFKTIYEMQNSSSGLDQDCIRAFGIKNGWRCFLPQQTFKFIKHPVFVLNAAYDVWAMLYFVGIDCKFPIVTVQAVAKKSDVDDNSANSVTSYVTNHRDVRDTLGEENRRTAQNASRVSRDFSQAPPATGMKNSRAVRDISGFEISPYFRGNVDKTKVQISTDASSKKDDYASSIDIRKDGIPSKGANPEKRNFEPPLGESDMVDSLNTFSLNDYADNYYNDRAVRPHNVDEAEQGPKLHLNIEQENPTDQSRMADVTTNVNEAEVPSIQNIKDMSNILANDKQEAMTLNPLASSVSALNNIAENVQKDNMDTETVGLLNEVFRKLKNLMPRNGGNATGGRRPNSTSEMINAGSPRIDLQNAQLVNGNIEGGQYPSDQSEVKIDENELNGSNINREKTDKEEQLKSKDITRKINEMLKVKQAELMKIKQQKNALVAKLQNKQADSSSSDILANMFKKAGKLPNTPNIIENSKGKLPNTPNAIKENSKGKLQSGPPAISHGLNRNSIMQNKNKRSANIIKEYINILRSDPPECTENQMINVMKYRNAMLRATAIVKATKNAGIFLVSCIEHSMSLFDETWTGVIVQKKSIQQAFGDWYFGRDTGHYIIDGVYPSNPSCP